MYLFVTHCERFASANLFSVFRTQSILLRVMVVETLARYIYAFSHLRVDRSKTRTLGVAPHKPVLLLSVIQAFEQQLLTDSHIPIIPELVGLFKSNWLALVKTNHQMRFALPFYHLQSEGFWQLVANPGYETWLASSTSLSGFSGLTAAVAYARIDEDLYRLLRDPQGREALRIALLTVWFPEANTQVLYPTDYLDTLAEQMREESGPAYRTQMEQLQVELDKEAYQEEVFLRGGVFRREVSRLYGYACCISGLRVDATFPIAMIDACHIVPFSESHDNTVTNGIALCPTLHRAFDRGLISLTDQYEVLVSDRFTERASTHAIRPFAGKRIMLPTESMYPPDPKNLAWHRERVFQK